MELFEFGITFNMNISIEKSLLEKWPITKLGLLLIEVQTSTDYPQLLSHIKTEAANKSARLEIDMISKIPAIAMARKAYKAIGKDPARYRLSAEALLRRIVNGKGLYQINNIVDALNLVSIQSGISIGGYDYKKIIGEISFGIGKNAEPYEGIGKGGLNIEYMPVLRDEQGAFGSPTSDSKRTMVTQNTTNFLMVFFGFEGLQGLEDSMQQAGELMNNFAAGNILGQKIM